MANTSETLGSEQAVLDGLVSHTLTEFEDDTVTKLGDNALILNKALISVSLPNLTQCGSAAFQGCTALESAIFARLEVMGSNMFRDCAALETVDLTHVTQVGPNAFNGCSSLGVVELPACTSIGVSIGGGNGPEGFDFTQKLTIPANAFQNGTNMKHLNLRANEVCPLSDVNAFTGTPISIGCGYIYVPAALVDTYKAATNWATYAAQIVPLTAYPKKASGSIADDWATILANPDYATDYAVGDTKVLDIDGMEVLMKIAAFDTDDLSSGSGKAGITWISAGSIEKRSMNVTSTTAGGWADSEMRSYLSTTLLPKIDATVRAGIKEVNKTYRVKSPSDSTQTCADKLWIPSYKEVGFTNASYIESSGTVYSQAFPDNASRVKNEGGYGLGSANQWWLRSARNATSFVNMNSNGSEGSTGAVFAYGVVLGFCTN